MKIVIALGGNALGENPDEQLIVTRSTAGAIVDLVEEGHEIVVVHGNGPQVGMIETAFATAAREDNKIPTMPMPLCVALSQGYIGYDLQCAIRLELEKRAVKKEVATVITMVEVNPADKAFENPTKPIGIFLTEEEAKALKEKGLSVMEDAGRGWRQVVASPKPMNIIEVNTVKTLLAAGHIPITVGGGGIPVAKENDEYKEKSAVIDKDFSAAKLAELIGADMLIILTAVEKVAINFGKPNQEWLDTLTVAEAEKYIAENQFAKGSMLPKVQAAVSFVKASPGSMHREPHSALITLLSKAREGIGGRTGTRIVL
jgi:carbamate kinase